MSDKARQTASFVAMLKRGQWVVTDRPGRVGRTMTEAEHAFREARFCELPEHLRRIRVADHMDK